MEPPDLRSSNQSTLFLIIEQSLTEGRYSVNLDAGTGMIDWSFNVINIPGNVRNLTGTRSSDGTVRIKWAPPLEDGGSPIVSYSVVVDGTAFNVAAATQGLDYDDPDPSEGTWVDVFAQTEWYPDGGGWPAMVYVEPLTTNPSGLFVDDDDSIFEQDIEWLAQADITKGCNPSENDRFCPNDNVTRGQMAAFLTRALSLADQLHNLFGDDDGSIFETDIEKLAAAGITKGCNPPLNDRFCPNGNVTHGQMAAFLVRALDYSDAGTGDLFTDDDGSTFETDIEKLARQVSPRMRPPLMIDSVPTATSPAVRWRRSCTERSVSYFPIPERRRRCTGLSHRYARTNAISAVATSSPVSGVDTSTVFAVLFRCWWLLRRLGVGGVGRLDSVGLWLPIRVRVVLGLRRWRRRSRGGPFAKVCRRA